VGQRFPWPIELSLIDRQEDERSERHIAEVEEVLTAHADSLREALPDNSLRVLYDRWVDASKGPHRLAGTSPDVPTLLRTLRITTDWLDPQPGRPVRPPQDSGIEPSAADVVWRNGTPEEKAELLENVQALAQRVYDAARKSIAEQWAEATSTGRQQELIERWRALLLRYVVQAGAASWGAVESPRRVAAPPRRLAQSPTRNQGAPAPVVPLAAVVQKTWIEVRLVDEEGTPIGLVRYEVELPDGSLKSGMLDERGIARFEDIDPGKCQVTFPDIDGREWRRA
jgi:hypothetical protein